MELNLVEKIKELFTSVAFDSYRVNDYLFEQNNPTAAMFYLNLANSNVAIIKSIYYCNYNELARNDMEDLFHQFDVFVNEVTRNFSTNHSHQWPNIEYNQFIDTLYSTLDISIDMNN